MRKKIKVKIIEESLWDRLPQHVKDEINGIINSKPKEMVEVKHGRWIKDRLCSTSGGTYEVRRCSVCEHYFQDLVNEYNYCPNCGAKMDGER